MLRKILIGLGVIIALLIVAVAVGAYYFMPDENVVLDRLVDHPESSAILLVRNDTVLAEQNLDKVMPLASTMKFMLTIEYAVQAGAGVIDPDEMIPLSELRQFYVANTDGGAHPAWLKHAADHIIDDKIAVRHIARGMMAFSSNANTEWLGMRLGWDKINARIDSLGLQNHTAIYPIVSALFVGKEQFPDRKGEELAGALRGLDDESYLSIIDKIHLKLLTDTTYKQDVGDLNMDVQRVWSDRLPASTVRDYVLLMKKINSRTYFDAETQKYIDEVMGYLMEYPKYREWLDYAGMKGGSTAFVLTKALYATDKKGHRTELAYFFDDLGVMENLQLQVSMNEFELKLLTKPAFRAYVQQAFSER